MSALILLVFQMGCSNNNLAGGTGAGNPGGVTAVSIIAHSDQSENPVDPMRWLLPEGYIGNADGIPYTPLIIYDEGNLLFTVTTAVLKVNTIHFVLADDEPLDIEKLLKDFSAQLSSDSESIIYKGPFTFDALNGTSQPPIDKLQLPEARYRGLRLMMGSFDNITTTSLIYNVTLEGTFTYKDTLRYFSIRVLIDQNRLYKNPGPPFQISAKNTTRFMLLLNAAHWLDYINFKQMLDDNILKLNSQGNLVVDENIDDAPYKDIKKAIRSNIPESGVLVISAAQ
jgi:hypothetical protein